MDLKPRFTPYNNGVMYICQPTEEKSSFAAAKNPTKESDFKKLEHLDFEEKSRREQDMDFAEGQGRALSMKVKTRLREWIDKTYPVIISGVLYSTIHIDYDRRRREMYFYLEEVRKLK